MWSGVDSGYIRAMARNARKTRILGIMLLTNGTSITFDDDDVLAGSLSVDNACVSGSAFEIGAVYAGQLKMSINTTLDRFSIYGATITLSSLFYAEADSNTYYTIPLGIFTVAEAVRSGNWISITAYDNMIKFDKEYPTLEEYEYIEGTPLAFLQGICTECGITLGNTDQEITDWSVVSTTTGNVITVGFSWRYSFGTYRGLLSQLATLLGAYATIGRDGKLYLKRYSTPTTGDGKTWTVLSDADIKKREIADYSVQFTSLQMSFPWSDERDYTLSFGADKSSIYAFSSDLLYAVESIYDIRDIGESLKTLITGITYTPVNFTIMGNPAIDVGDGLLFTDKDGDVISSYYMQSTWTHHGNHVVAAPGANAAVTGTSTGAQKTMQLINAASASATCRFKHYANGSSVTITDGVWSPVISTTVSAGNGTAFLLGSAKFTTSISGSFGANVSVNGTPVNFTPQMDADGIATLTFWFPLELNYGNNTVTLSMTAAAGGEATIAAGECIIGIFSSALK